MHTLSSEFTFIQKFGVPLVLFIGLSLGVFEAIRTHAPVPVFVILTACVVFAWLLIRRRSFPLKRVTATHGGLLVSNFVQEIAIPYSQIADVYMEYGGRHSTVTLVLKAPSRFGLYIDFIPHVFIPPWHPHPVLAFIREHMIR
ncbi:MAG: hypothetical protein AB7K71_01380 [Polyangiaceae bacterium]